jgi:hypothetical protein
MTFISTPEARVNGLRFTVNGLHTPLITPSLFLRANVNRSP